METPCAGLRSILLPTCSTYASVMRPLRQILGAETTLAEWQRRRQRELGLQKQLERALPAALAPHVRVADARSPELELVASSGAAAALIRQRVPDVLRELAGKGWEFTGIRVRVQARPMADPPPKRHMKQIDGSVAGALRALAANVGSGPLAEALERLARHAGGGGRSGRDDKSFEGVKNEDGEQ